MTDVEDAIAEIERVAAAGKDPATRAVILRAEGRGFNAGVDHAGTTIGQPTSFYVGCALNLTPPDPAAEINNLRRKMRAGADFILTQPIYDTAAARAFLAKARQALGEFPLRVLVGVLPLVSARHASFLQHEVPGIHVPEEIYQRMSAAGEQAAQEGIKIGMELVDQIREFAQGIYLMPAFNRFDYAAQIVEYARSSGT